MAQEPNVDDVAGAVYAGIAVVARRLRHSHVAAELSLPERSAMSRLDRGGPATAAELARAEQITPQAMAIVVNSLQERGFVQRRPDPGDGRRIIVSLSRTGFEILRHKRDARARQLAKVLGEQFTTAELRTLAVAAPLIERLGEHL